MRPATLSQAAPSEAAVTVWGRSCIAAGRLSPVSRHAAAPVLLDHTTGLAVKWPHPQPVPPWRGRGAPERASAGGWMGEASPASGRMGSGQRPASRPDLILRAG